MDSALELEIYRLTHMLKCINSSHELNILIADSINAKSYTSKIPWLTLRMPMALG